MFALPRLARVVTDYLSATFLSKEAPRGAASDTQPCPSGISL